MAIPFEPKKISTLGIYGVVRRAEVDDSLIPDGAVTESINFHFDRKGASTIRPGLTVLGATVLTARPCVGLHNALSGTAIAVFSNGGSSTIYSFDGSAWTMSLDGGTASVRIRFLDFGSYTIALNFIYNTYSSMRYWNASSSRHWHNTGNPINVQNMWGYNPQLGEVFKNRIYLAGDTSTAGSPSRLYFSSVISSTGRVTWTPTVDYVDINPGDGEDITGLKRYSLELLLFKPNYIYRFRTSGVDADPLIKVGTRSQESIVEGKRGLYFHHDTGFYRYSGGYPLEISRPISDVVEAIPYGQFDDIVGWNDSDHIYWSIASVTISEPKGDVTWKNVVIRYTESSEIWTIYSYANEIRRGMMYTRGTTLSRLVGTDHGVVGTFNSGTTDFGEPLEFRMRTKWYFIEDLASHKIIQQIVAYAEKAQGLELRYRVDEKREWKTIGQLRQLVTNFNSLDIGFNRIQFEVSGTTRYESSVFLGLDIIKGLNEGIL